MSKDIEDVGGAQDSPPPILQLPLSSNETALVTDQSLYEPPPAMEQYGDPAAMALFLEHHENKHVEG